MKTIFAVIIVVMCWASLLLANVIRVPLDPPSIQAGINAAVNGDTVLVAAGTYYENINFKGKAVTVASHFLTDGDTTHVNNTIINGSQPSHADSGSVVFFVSGEDTTSILCGFTITGGTGTETIGYEATKCRAGGGLLCYNAGARIQNNKITGNAVSSPDKIVIGGGMVCNCPPTDYDGNQRPNPVDEFVDMGAFESEFLKAGTGIENKKELIPDKFSLEQNYPNPFSASGIFDNPSTTIEFALPQSTFVTLKVYNLLGEAVATLVAEQRAAGIYKLNWDARGLASGMYLYRLEAGKFVQSKKLILMR